MYFSKKQIQESLEEISNIHPFFTITFLSFKRPSNNCSPVPTGEAFIK